MVRKGKKKQYFPEQEGSSGSGVRQDPKPSISVVSGEKEPEIGTATGGDQSKSEEWTTIKGRGWEKPGDYQPKKKTDDGGRYQQKPSESVRKPRDQQKGDQQWASGGHGQKSEPPQRHSGRQQSEPSGGQPWSGKGHQKQEYGGFQPRQDRGQDQGQNKGHEQRWREGEGEYLGSQKQGQRGAPEQRRSHQQQRRDGGQVLGERQQFRDDSRSSQKHCQIREGQQEIRGNIEQKTNTPGEQYQPQESQPNFKRNVWQKQQPSKVAEELPNVGQSKQSSDKKEYKREPPTQGGQGAPDKVQFPSSSVSKLRPQKSESPESEDTIRTIAPVYKEPGTWARKTIKVQSNHFALDLGNLKEAYHYNVTITDFNKNKQEQAEKLEHKKEERTSKNRRIKDKVQYKVVQEFLKKHFPQRYPSFDGKKNLYTSKPLTDNLNDVLTDPGITVFDDFEKEKTFCIEIHYVKTLSLVPQVQGDRPHTPMLTQNAIQCIDIVLRNAPIRCFNQIGSSFFSKPGNKIIELGGGMEMYYGFYQSAIIGGGRPLLNLHLVHKAFPKNMPVLDAFVEILKEKDKRTTYRHEDIGNVSSRLFKALNDYIMDLKVAYEVPRMSKVIYRVNKLVGTPKQEKMIHNGTEKTILEYFRTEKQYNIKNPDVPLLWVGNPKGKIRILIPPELCKIEKDQSVKRKLEDFQTRNMIGEAATSTHEHKNNTMARFREAGYNNSHCVKEFNFSVSDKFEIMDARILPTPQLQYSNGSVNVKKGTWQSLQFLNAKTINKWAIVDVSNDKYVNESKLRELVQELGGAAKSCGVTIAGEPVLDMVRGRSRYDGPTKTDIEQYFKNQKNKNYDIIFVIVPSSEQGNSIYAYVKGAAELITGCLTQCLKAKTVTGRISTATATNILLKVNGKLDGVNHTFSATSKPKVLQDVPVMIMGADVTHPGPTAGMMPSVAAVLASHDPKAFQYNLCLRLQEPKMEYILDLKEIVKEQLMFFYRKNDGARPQKIIYFRDGVSEGQFAQVLDIELRAIQDACKESQKEDYNPSITFLVVQKRHHTRLFPLNDRDSEDQDFDTKFRSVKGNYNVPAGTCVDTKIVNPITHNFYLVSHASIKGVARPTKYCTLWDDLNLSSNEVEELTYYLCHMFARCNRSVSYPAPTYYAHLGALRGKAYIKPALDNESFDLTNLQKEMDKRQIQFNILNDNPMFFI